MNILSIKADNIMKRLQHGFLRELLLPKISSELAEDLDRLNINSILVIMIFTIVIEVLGMIPLGFYINDKARLMRILFSFTYCITVCGIGVVLCLIVRKKEHLNHRAIIWSIFTGAVLLIGWGMYISYSHYVYDEQIITFYCVICIIASFVNLHPLHSLCLIFGSFCIYYFALYSFDNAASIDLFNFFSFGLLLTATSIGKYHTSLQQLKDKREIRRLNDSLKKDIISASDQVTKKELELSNMKIRMMQQQISPHFIFNALGIIKSLIWEDREKAEDSVTEFSLYLRRNIEALRSSEMILFSKELEHINAFLAIEKADETVDLTVEYDLQTKDFYVPPLSVEPIVENAVIHGVSKRESGALIRICTLELPTEYHIIISDNGAGFERSERKSGVGIENVRTRLKYQCGGNLSIQSGHSGTTVTITIPKTEVQHEHTDLR